MNRQNRSHPTHPLLPIQNTGTNRTFDEKKHLKKYSTYVKSYNSIRRKLGAK